MSEEGVDEKPVRTGQDPMSSRMVVKTGTSGQEEIDDYFYVFKTLIGLYAFNMFIVQRANRVLRFNSTWNWARVKLRTRFSCPII